MSKITFILGGARSGKSALALELAKKQGGKIAFIATCEPLDAEMKKRIARHKSLRPEDWQTFEEPRGLALLLNSAANEFDCLVIDCLTLLVSNLLLKGADQEGIEKEIHSVLSLLKKGKNRAIIVSNEVGLSIVPDNKLGRNFRDIAGKVNQIVAAKADEVIFMVAGLPWKIK